MPEFVRLEFNSWLSHFKIFTTLGKRDTPLNFSSPSCKKGMVPPISQAVESNKGGGISRTLSNGKHMVSAQKMLDAITIVPFITIIIIHIFLGKLIHTCKCRVIDILTC